MAGLGDIIPLRGSLIAPKTIQEIRAVDHIAGAYTVAIKIKSANQALKALDAEFKQPSGVGHLRRFSKPSDLPEYIKSQADSCTSGKLYVLIPPPLPDTAKLKAVLEPFAFEDRPSSSEKPCDSPSKEISRPDSMLPGSFVTLIPIRVPLSAPTTLEQARTWTHTLWPTIFNPAAHPSTHAPPPGLLAKTQASLQPTAGFYLALARRLAQDAEQERVRPQIHDQDQRQKQAQTQGLELDSCDGCRGRPVGAVIVDPSVDTSNHPNGVWGAVVAGAGDARYWKYERKPSSLPFSSISMRITRAMEESIQNRDQEQETDSEIGATANVANEANKTNEKNQTNVADKKSSGNISDGRPELHAVMRAIAIVSDKLLQRENDQKQQQSQQQHQKETPSSVFPSRSASQPSPPSSNPLSTTIPSNPIHVLLTPLENILTPLALPPTYLCTALDLYVTHEPCLMCAMAALLSRFRAIVYERRTRRPDAALDTDTEGNGGGNAYGLHWRKELNWRALAFRFDCEQEGGKTGESQSGPASFNA